MPPPSTEDRVAGALYAMMAGDALAVPLHWYYTRETRDEHRAKYYNDTLDRFYQIDPEIREKHPDSGNYFKVYVMALKTLIFANISKCLALVTVQGSLTMRVSFYAKQ